MNFNIAISLKLTALVLLVSILAACNDGELAVNPTPVVKAPFVNTSPGDFTFDLTGENISCF